jgi:hypothetical protein
LKASYSMIFGNKLLAELAIEPSSKYSFNIGLNYWLSNKSAISALKKIDIWNGLSKMQLIAMVD